MCSLLFVLNAQLLRTFKNPLRSGWIFLRNLTWCLHMSFSSFSPFRSGDECHCSTLRTLQKVVIKWNNPCKTSKNLHFSFLTSIHDFQFYLWTAANEFLIASYHSTNSVHYKYEPVAWCLLNNISVQTTRIPLCRNELSISSSWIVVRVNAHNILMSPALDKYNPTFSPVSQ